MVQPFVCDNRRDRFKCLGINITKLNQLCTQVTKNNSFDRDSSCHDRRLPAQSSDNTKDEAPYSA